MVEAGQCPKEQNEKGRPLRRSSCWKEGEEKDYALEMETEECTLNGTNKIRLFKEEEE